MNRLNRSRTAVLIGILVSQWAVAAPRTPAEIRAAIQGKMAERHPEGVEEFWASLGPEALPVLKQLYASATGAYERTWLLDGLSHFDDPSIGTLLQAEIPGQTDKVLQRKMLSALVRSQGEASLEFVEPYLRDPDPHIRRAVATGLKLYGGARATARVQDYLKSEKEPWIRDSVERGVAAPRTLKRESSPLAKSTPIPTPTPLPQKDWAGEWKGAWITPDKNSAAQVTLTLLNPKATAAEQKWRIELKLPKKSRQEIHEKDLELSVSAGPTVHWLQIRSKKTDAVFIAHRKAKE